MPQSEQFFCAVLGHVVELTAERRSHITEAHRANAATIIERLEAVVSEPDIALRSSDNRGEFLLARAFEFETGSKHIVAIIVEQQSPSRLWIVTAFLTRRLSRGGRWIAI